MTCKELSDFTSTLAAALPSLPSPINPSIGSTDAAAGSTTVAISLDLLARLHFEDYDNLKGNHEALVSALLSLTHIRLSNLGLRSLDNLECLGRVTHLYLRNNSLESADGVDYLPDLKVLDISENRMHSVAPLRMLRHLQWLDVRGNRIGEHEEPRYEQRGDNVKPQACEEASRAGPRPWVEEWSALSEHLAFLFLEGNPCMTSAEWDSHRCIWRGVMPNIQNRSNRIRLDYENGADRYKEKVCRHVYRNGSAGGECGGGGKSSVILM